MKTQLTGTIGIVGLGLIGGSLGLDLQSLGLRVHGLVNRPETLKRAKERGLASIVSTNPEILKDCELIIIALPIPKIIQPPTSVITALPKDAVITDVASVKEPILKIWKSLHPKFVASHPMAGNTFSGVEAGQLGLFKNCPWVVTPDSDTDSASLEIIKNLALDLGSRLIISDAAKHDEAVALISHLPVIISAALIKTLSEQKDPNIIELSKKLASSGFADTSRVGGGNPELGTSMASNNTSSILRALSSYRWSLEQLEGVVLSENWSQLLEELKLTQSLRQDFTNNDFQN